ncbi:MAG: hypothetical protein KGI71_05240 [Patescibacteria group bacterium]|nr:hypothetical protein [Patescibacteria group bacterium]
MSDQQATTTTQPAQPVDQSNIAATDPGYYGSGPTGQPLNNDSLRAAANAAPTNSPSTTLGIAASAASPAEAALNAQVASTFQRASVVAGIIKGMGVDFQRTYWDSRSHAEQSLLAAAGYSPPQAQDVSASGTGGGFWHGVMHIGDDLRHAGAAVGDTFVKALKLPLTAVGDAFNAAISPLTQGVRAGLYNAQQGNVQMGEQGKSTWSPENILHALDPIAIMHDWNAVSNGATTFSPESLHYVTTELGVTGATLQFAKILASGQTLQQALGALPGTERPTAFAMYNDPKFMEAVNLLSDSHLSLGQAIFGGLNPAQMKQMFPKENLGLMRATAFGGQAASAVGGAAAIATGDEEGGLSLLGAGARGALARGVGSALGAGAVMGALNPNKSVDQMTAAAPFGMQVHPLSGITDGLVQWYGNPLFVGLQGRAAYNSAVHDLATLDAMGNARDIPHYYATNGAGRRFAQAFVAKVTSPWRDASGAVSDTPNFMTLDQYGIKTAGMEEVINKYWPDLKKAATGADGMTPEQAVGNMMADQTALVNLFRGRGAMLYRDATQFPHLTVTQKMLEDLKGIGRTAMKGRRFNPNKLSPRQLASEVFGPSITEAGMAPVKADQALGPVARFTRRFTSLVPTEPWIDVTDPQWANKVERFASFSLPNDMIAQYRNAAGATVTQEARIRLLDGLTRDVFNAAHVYDTPEGAKWAEDWLSRQKYTFPDGAEYINPADPTGPRVSHAILDSQLSSQYGLPNFRELLKFSKKSWLMSKLQMGMNADMVDRAMSNFWKPLLLLRPGFALRFAGEEILNFILREGPLKWLQARVAASTEGSANALKEALAQRALDHADEWGMTESDIAAINQMDAKSLAKALMSHVPGEALQTIRTRAEAMANIQGWHAIKWMRRGVARTITPEWLLNGAANLAKHGVYDTAFSDYIDAVTSHGGSVYFNDPLKKMPSLLKGEEGTPISITGSGKFASYSREDAEAIPAWIWALEGVAKSKLGRVAARAWSKGGVDTQVQAVMDYINGAHWERRLAEAGNNEELKALAQQGMERHAEWRNRFVVYGQTKDGQLVTTPELQQQAVRDWAEAVVEHVNRLTMTTAPQDFTEVEGEKVPVPTSGPQPIRLTSPGVGSQPYEIATRDEGRTIAASDETTAYRAVPAEHVRLFRAENSTTAQRSTEVVAPGRDWTPSFRDAANRAGEGGQVYEMDVPENVLRQDYTFHGPGDREAYIKEIQQAQHAGAKGAGSDPVVRGTWESGNIKHGRIGESVPNLLIDRIGQNLVPGSDELERIDRAHYPDGVVAEEQVAKLPPGKDTLQALVNGGMRRFVGKPANWMSRQPIFTYNYSVALREAESMLRARGIEDASGDLAHDIAMDRATSETLPYIHNPATRSQFSVVTRNLMPFWFAQEQFYKRWIRLFGTYPEAWYKLSQTMNGLKSVGFVQKDAYGKDAFVYPGSPAMLSLLSRFPFHGSLPIAVGFSGEISQLNPTLTTGGTPIPSFGPIATVPMSVAAMIHPGLDPVAQAMLGPEAPQLNANGDGWMRVIEQMLPSVASRFIDWASAPKNSSSVGSPLYMSTMIQAAQQMEANGYGLTAEDERNPRKVQQYLDRLRNWTKNMILMRTFFGLLAPATPTFKINDNGLGAQFSALLATMPYDQAVTEFIKAHPNATADTIFESTTGGKMGSGAYVPATKAAGDYIMSNASFFDNYPQLAPWSIPTKDATGLFDATTYQSEKALGLRFPRSLNDWYDQVKYAEAANVYFPLEQAKTAAIAGTITPDQKLALIDAGFMGGDKAALNQWWDQWKGSVTSGTGFLAAHPIFASMVGEPTASNRRSAIIGDLQDAISKGALPDTTWSHHAEALMWGFQQVQEYYTKTIGNTAYSTQRKQNKDAFIAWGDAYAKAHPEVSAFWQGVMRKEVPG